MPYNESYGPCRRMKEHLDTLFQREETVDFATDDPKSLAYKLREAIHASQFWDDYEHFHQLKDMYEFQRKDGYVRARYLGERAVIREEDGATRAATDFQPMSVTEVSGLQGVVGAALKFEDKTDEIRFPNAVLMEGEKERLFSWTEQQDWKIIDQEEGGLTLTRRNVAENITWKPEGTDV